jgi:hypothetical protein
LPKEEELEKEIEKIVLRFRMLDRARARGYEEENDFSSMLNFGDY